MYGTRRAREMVTFSQTLRLRSSKFQALSVYYGILIMTQSENSAWKVPEVTLK